MSKFKITGNEGNYRFNLYAKNNKIIGRSSEGYSTKSSCKDGVESVITNSKAPIIDLTKGEIATGSRFEVFFSSELYWFRLKAGNGETILASQGYTRKKSALDGIKSVVINAPNAVIED